MSFLHHLPEVLLERVRIRRERTDQLWDAREEGLELFVGEAAELYERILLFLFLVAGPRGLISGEGITRWGVMRGSDRGAILCVVAISHRVSWKSYYIYTKKRSETLKAKERDEVLVGGDSFDDAWMARGTIIARFGLTPWFGADWTGDTGRPGRSILLKARQELRCLPCFLDGISNLRRKEPTR